VFGRHLARRFDSFERFVGILLEHSQKVFAHYHGWGMLYRQLSKSVLLRPDVNRTRHFFETEDGRRESEVGRPFVGWVAWTHA